MKEDHVNRRLARFLERLAVKHLDAFLVTHPANLQYLFQFFGSSGMALATQEGCTLLVDSRYLEQARQQARNCQPVLVEGSYEDSLKKLLEKLPAGTRLGVESRNLSYEAALRIEAWKLDLILVPAVDVVEELRLIKDDEEIRLLEGAFQRSIQALEAAKARFRPGVSELEMAGYLEFECRRFGGQGQAFETIVATGPRSALPHGVATARRLATGEFVLVDFGIRYLGYCSDLTRILFPKGSHPPEIYDIVRRAQQAALDTIRPGVLTSRVDEAARGVISASGYGTFFGHGTGHGLGLEVHEAPTVSPRNPREITAGMVFTVEPGIYLPGRYGIRLEDVVLVTETGYRFLSRRV